MMKRVIRLGEANVSYSVRVSRRGRHLRMTVGVKDGLVVIIPTPWHERYVQNFLREKAKWILKHLKSVSKQKNKTVLPHNNGDYAKNKKLFLQAVTKRVEFFNSLYNFQYNKISIRNQTSLWGSCTRAGNLQFNFKLSYLPQTSIDYVIVHELCHLKEHNHGPRFWHLVEKTIPEYKAIRKSLHGYVMQES